MTEKEKRNLEEWVSQALDGELNQDELDKVQRLMARDPHASACRAAWARQGDLLRNLPAPAGPNPALVWERVQAELALPVPAPIVFPRRMIYAAAAALVLVAGTWSWLGSRDATSPVFAGNPAEANVVEYVEAELPNHSPVVYVDAESGATVIWMEEWVDEGDGAGG